MTKLNSIQFLRAIAAILVVYHHVLNQNTGNATSWQQNFYYLKNFGNIGVDLFFVISGFIIMYVANTYSGLQQGINFLAKRFFRINPVYYIATLLYLLELSIFQMSGINVPQFSSFSKAVNSLSDAILIFPSTGDMESFSPLVAVGWTLSFEWLFYALFSLLIICKVNQKTFYLIGLIGMLSLLGLILKPDDFRFIFLTNPILLEFLLGAVICRLYLNKYPIPTYISMGLILTGLSIYALLLVYGFGDIWHYQNVLNSELSIKRFILWGLPSSFILSGCIFLETNSKFNWVWHNKWIQLVGDASYSIYLIHFVIFPLLGILFIKTIDIIPVDIIMLLQLLSAVVVSIIFYRIAEKPLLRYIRYNKFWNSLITNKSKSISYE